MSLPSPCPTIRLSEDLSHPLIGEENIEVAAKGATSMNSNKGKKNYGTLNAGFEMSPKPVSPTSSLTEDDSEAWATSSIQSQSQIAIDLANSNRPIFRGRRKSEKLTNLFNKVLGRNPKSIDNIEDRSFDVAEAYARRRQSELKQKEKIAEHHAKVKEGRHSLEMEKAAAISNRRGILEKIETSRIVQTPEQMEKTAWKGKNNYSPTRRSLKVERNEESSTLLSDTPP
ncbi:hypothetical protein TrST_g13025 [Triparma strigata]|uniref:Uncharacterized protein n=1 Tax=Triparma strigata TaxID=1606541 RepID=A0A9W6ZXH7_9STRA|nr:hypothetical protein TrST_g13025 [Triparma strigata]